MFYLVAFKNNIHGSLFSFNVLGGGLQDTFLELMTVRNIKTVSPGYERSWSIIRTQLVCAEKERRLILNYVGCGEGRNKSPSTVSGSPPVQALAITVHPSLCSILLIAKKKVSYLFNRPFLLAYIQETL